MLRRRRGSAAN